MCFLSGDCKYKFGPWGSCDAASNTKSRSGTLKRALFNADCQATVKVSKPCSPKVKKAKGETWLVPVPAPQHRSTTAPQHRNTQVKHSIKTQIHYLMNLHISLSFSRGQEVKLTDEKRRRRRKDSFLFLQLNNRLPPSSNSNNRETPPEHTNTFHCRPPLTFILVLLILIWSSCVYLD